MLEKQYIELFSQNRSLLDQNSDKLINGMRDVALDNFEKTGFPTKTLEDYQNSDIARKFRDSYQLDTNNTIKTNPYTQDYKFSVKDLTNQLYFTVNSYLYTESLPDSAYPKGAFVGSLRQFAQLHPEVFSKYYGKLADIENNSLAALNTMFAQDGLVVYLPDNAVVEEPIQLVNLLDSESSLFVNRRILIIAGRNSQAKLFTSDYCVNNTKYLITQVVEIYADENAHIDFYELEESSENTVRLASTFVKEEKGASVLANNITISCGFTRNNYNVKLDGENAEAYVAGIVVADKQQHVDNFVFLDHLKPHCTSTQLFKYVLQDKSLGSFCGRIRVEKDAQKTLAYQTNNNLCVSPDAEMYAKPQLEIYADDVKCSHGLTTGQLDENALFYLRARGISEESAKLMLMQAFTSDVLSLVRLESLHTKLTEIIEKRFQR